MRNPSATSTAEAAAAPNAKTNGRSSSSCRTRLTPTSAAAIPKGVAVWTTNVPTIDRHVFASSQIPSEPHLAAAPPHSPKDAPSAPRCTYACQNQTAAGTTANAEAVAAPARPGPPARINSSGINAMKNAVVPLVAMASAPSSPAATIEPQAPGRSDAASARSRASSISATASASGWMFRLNAIPSGDSAYSAR